MWVLINSGVIIDMILISASYGSQPLGFSHMIFLFQLQECRWWWKVTLGHFFWKTIGQCLKVTSSNQNLFRAYQTITYGTVAYQPWKTMKNHEKPWKTIENHEKTWKTMKNYETVRFSLLFFVQR